MSGLDDFAFEPVKGLPETLPASERMLWQGAPRWQDLAVHAFHARKAFIYFILLGLVQGAVWLKAGYGLGDTLISCLWFLVLGAAAAGLLTGLAYASARTSVYTITSKRLVMRIGIALPVTINLPFKLIDHAAVKLYRNGSGDLVLTVAKGNRLAYALLWPHARRWHFSNPQPALRCIGDADRVASLLAAALTSSPLPAMAKPADATGKPYAGQPVAA